MNFCSSNTTTTSATGGVCTNLQAGVGHVCLHQPRALQDSVQHSGEKDRDLAAGDERDRDEGGRVVNKEAGGENTRRWFMFAAKNP